MTLIVMMTTMVGKVRTLYNLGHSMFSSSLQSGLRFIGLDVLSPNIGLAITTPEAGKTLLSSWSKRLERIFEEKALFFFPLTDYSASLELKEEVIDRAVNRGDTGPTVGQHLGMRVPSDSMRRRVSF